MNSVITRPTTLLKYQLIASNATTSKSKLAIIIMVVIIIGTPGIKEIDHNTDTAEIITEVAVTELLLSFAFIRQIDMYKRITGKILATIRVVISKLIVNIDVMTPLKIKMMDTINENQPLFLYKFIFLFINNYLITIFL